MVNDTGIYLKTAAGSSPGRRLLVVVEPLLDPSQTNARVYGADYVVVASPVNGDIHMREVRHAFLDYQIEPLLYARAGELDRFLPFLKTVRDAPLDYTYRSDIVALVVECMIRAIEARTMDTGVAYIKSPPISGAAIWRRPPGSTMPRLRLPKPFAAAPSRSPWWKAMCLRSISITPSLRSRERPRASRKISARWSTEWT